jgi:Zn-dependent M28 family amino/carboxypeptidase
VPVNDILIPSPAADTSSAGCEPEDFPAATTGAISLLQRGTCPFVQQLANAQAAGAVGAILMNEGDSPGRVNAGFRAGPPDLAIPAVFSSFAVGQELHQAFKDGKAPTVRLETDGKSVDRFFPQVVAETRTGDPRHMVLAGAHLDSVPAGPGINDDGSGTAWQLALAERTDVMIDTDMIALANSARLIYDGDGSEPGGTPGPDGSGAIENVFARYFARRGMATERIPFDGRSDYVGFVNRGIPAGGIFAGAEAPKTAEQVALYGGVEGEQLDPCYHEACDNIGTVTGQPLAATMNTFATNPALAQQQADQLQGNALKSLREMSGAVTHSIWVFGQNRHGVGSRTTADRKRAQRRASSFRFEGHPRAHAR